MLTSFSNDKDVRYDKDIRKRYLQGRLGGVPRLLLQGAIAPAPEDAAGADHGAQSTPLRAAAERPYRTMFVISIEGVKTEPQSFAVFNGTASIVRVHGLPGSSASAPTRVIKRMREHIRDEGLRGGVPAHPRR